MLRNETSVRVRYAETDQMGYAYHGNYVQYFEIGRTEILRELGFPYARMEKDGVLCPVMSMQFRFVRPAMYDELIKICTEIRKMPDDKVVFHHELYNEKGKLLCGGSVKLAFVSSDTRRRCQVPEVLGAEMRKSFE